MEDNVEITKSEYNRMQREIAKLNALEAGGVDNWEWYSDSLAEWCKENELNEFMDNAIIELHERMAESVVEQPAGQGCGYSVTLDDKNCLSFFKWFIDGYKAIGCEEK